MFIALFHFFNHRLCAIKEEHELSAKQTEKSDRLTICFKRIQGFFAYFVTSELLFFEFELYIGKRKKDSSFRIFS